MYEICLDSIQSVPLGSNGKACVEIRVTDILNLDYGSYDLCEIELLQGWKPDIQVDSIEWLAGLITLQDVEASGGILEYQTEDDCGCGYNQFIQINVIPAMNFYVDADMDGFGDPENFILSCDLPPGTTDNNEDCDDTDPNINPDATEVLDNDIDEDCDGVADMSVGTIEINGQTFEIYPNPTEGFLNIETSSDRYNYSIYNTSGQLILQKDFNRGNIRLNTAELTKGVYYVVIRSANNDFGIEKILKI